MTSVLKVQYMERNISSQHQTDPDPNVCLLKQPGIEARRGVCWMKSANRHVVTREFEQGGSFEVIR